MSPFTVNPWQIETRKEVPSTMDVARTMLERVQEASPLVVSTERQTAGRGRQGRTWFSEQGSLAATFVMSSPLAAARLSGFSLVVGTVLRDVCAELGGDVLLKWPNDILTAEGKKIAGVLIELLTREESTYVLIGIGMNLSSAPSQVSHSTSLREVLGREVTVQELLPIVCKHLWSAWGRFVQEGFPAFRDTWLSSAYGVGDTVTLDLGQRLVTGIIVGVSHSGELSLQTESGVEQIASGHQVDNVQVDNVQVHNASSD